MGSVTYRIAGRRGPRGEPVWLTARPPFRRHGFTGFTDRIMRWLCGASGSSRNRKWPSSDESSQTRKAAPGRAVRMRVRPPLPDVPDGRGAAGSRRAAAARCTSLGGATGAVRDAIDARLGSRGELVSQSAADAVAGVWAAAAFGAGSRHSIGSVTRTSGANERGLLGTVTTAAPAQKATDTATRMALGNTLT